MRKVSTNTGEAYEIHASSNVVDFHSSFFSVLIREVTRFELVLALSRFWQTYSSHLNLFRKL